MTTPNNAIRAPSRSATGVNQVTVNLAPCYVIHARAYRETSLLVDLFSLDYGCLSVVARGARGKSAPLRSLLQPFQALLASWSGRSELKSLRAVESHERPWVLSQRVLAGAFYLNELLARLLHHHEAYPALFACYADTLHALAAKPASMLPQLRLFEKRILIAIGYGLTLHRIAHSGQPVQLNQRYGFDPEIGILEHPLPSAAVSGATLLALEYETPWRQLAQRDARNFMRALIAYRIGYRPIAARTLLRAASPDLNRELLTSLD